MINDAILVPGLEEDNICDIPQEITPQEYLTIEGSLKEIADLGEGAKAAARTNLGVYSKSETADMVGKTETEINGLKNQVINTLNTLGLSLELIQQSLDSFVKLDGSTPFNNILSGITPSGDSNKNALITVQYLLNKLKNYSTSAETKTTIELSLDILGDYALLSEVYKKSNVYCKTLIDNLLKSFVKKDGSVPFESPLNGQYPKTRANLSTKGYVDDQLKEHRREVDPHNFITLINNKLSNYYKKSETYSKALTYSRVLIDEIIDKLVEEACLSLIELHLNTTLHLSTLEVRNIIKNYAASNLVTPELLEESLKNVANNIENVKPIWKTSGPVLTTVGFVEDNTELPSEMTMLEILDAIFYGTKLILTVDETVLLGQSTDVTFCSYGMAIDSAILYQNGEPVKSYGSDDFADNCITYTSDVITLDTEFTIEVIYSNGSTLIKSETVKVMYPAFIGLLPEWKFGNEVSYEYLEELARKDKINNIFFNGDGSNIEHQFSYTGDLVHPFIVIPSKYYSELDQMITPSQLFGIEAFNPIDMIPLLVPGTESDVMYTMYIYKLAIVKINLNVQFNFK